MSEEIKHEPIEREEKLDEMLDDTFPASDPPSTTPPSGTRKSKELAEADESDEAKPQSTPTADRHSSETAAGRQAGLNQPEKH